MRLLDKWERKFGKYAVHNLIKYVMVLYGVGIFIGLFVPEFYYVWLSLDVGQVLQGQVWRLFTFVLAPESMYGGISGILLVAIKVYLYLMIGGALENAWGAFRFNLYLLSGFLFTIIGAFVIYFVFGPEFSYSMGFYYGMDYTYQTMFFAFAAIYPDMKFLFWFLIPVKVKWLAMFDGMLIVVSASKFVINVYPVAGWRSFCYPVMVLFAFVNFFIFFFATLDGGRNPRAFQNIGAGRKRRRKPRQQPERKALVHRCAVCGRTPETNPELDFRFCSKCNGNYEYCSEHLFTHTHVK